MDSGHYLPNSSSIGGEGSNNFPHSLVQNQFKNQHLQHQQDRSFKYLPRITEEGNTIHIRQPVVFSEQNQQRHLPNPAAPFQGYYISPQRRITQQQSNPSQVIQHQPSPPQVIQQQLPPPQVIQQQLPPPQVIRQQPLSPHIQQPTSSQSNYNPLRSTSGVQYSSVKHQLSRNNNFQLPAQQQFHQTQKLQKQQQQNLQLQQKSSRSVPFDYTNQLPQKTMNNNTTSIPPAYSSPQGSIQIPNQQQAYSPSSYASSSYSTSPYSTSPYGTSPYSPQQRVVSSSPAQANQSYIPKSNSDPVLSHTLNTDVYQGDTYQTQYLNDGTYYPYHRDLLNAASGADLSGYAVKLDTGVIHQYPTPDYLTTPPEYDNTSQQVYYTKTQSNVSEYPPDLASSYYARNQNIQQDPSPRYDQYSQHLQQPALYPTQPQPDQYHQIMSQIPNKQVMNQSSDASQSQLQPPSLQQGDTSTYAGYRSTVLDSPQGSPLSVQTSPVIFKKPQETPPSQRRQTPVRQISNEIYKLDSPSNQLQLHEMSLNSPRPRSETIDMEPPPQIPPRSPVQKHKDENECVETFYTQSQQQSMPPPPSSQIHYSQNAQNCVPTQQNVYSNQRLRSGTVEMIDSVAPNSRFDSSSSRQMAQPSSSQRGTSSASQFNMSGQRSRAGTVEMLDNQLPCTTNDSQPFLNMPESRIRSGTVEMSEAGPPQQVYYQPVTVPVPQPFPQQQPPSQITTQQQAYNNKMSALTTPVSRITYDEKNPTSKQPPPYPTSSSSQQALQNQQQYSSPNQPQQPQVYQNSTTNGATTSPPQVPTKQQTSPLLLSKQQQIVPVHNKNTSLQPQAVQHSQRINASPNTNSYAGVSSQSVSSSQPDLGSQQNISLVASSQGRLDNKQYVPATQPAPQSNTQYSPNNTRSYQVEALENNGQLSEQDLERQQKMMQQQYVQRVRQAQLQQQLREIQSEYEANLQLEQDIAQEFLWEQKGGEPLLYTPPVLQHQRQQQASLQHHQQGQTIQRQLNPQVNTAYMSQSQQNQPRMPYMTKDGAVFPVTGLPINQPVYQQRINGQQRSIPSQPIVIMPGGGSFSNPGQFVPSNSMPLPRKEQRPMENTASRSQGKQQTPFQRLRKIAEDISSFVDDVVKFKGKKGDHEYKYLEEMLTQQLLLLDKVPANSTDELRNARKALVKEVQELLEILDRRSTQKE